MGQTHGVWSHSGSHLPSSSLCPVPPVSVLCIVCFSLCYQFLLFLVILPSVSVPCHTSQCLSVPCHTAQCLSIPCHTAQKQRDTETYSQTGSYLNCCRLPLRSWYLLLLLLRLFWAQPLINQLSASFYRVQQYFSKQRLFRDKHCICLEHCHLPTA